MEIVKYVLLFFVYGFLGWCCEVIYATLNTGKFVNRGFLNGPICSIYGFGVLIVLLALSPFKDNIFLLFIASFILTSLLEFITGFILEKFFHKKWWDYSKEHFNIKGYVCLKFSLLWGAACCFVVHLIHPLIEKGINLMPNVLQIVLIAIFALMYIVDNIVTILQIIRFNKFSKELTETRKLLRLSSDKIGETLSDVTNTLMEKAEMLGSKIKNSRLVKAFPKLHQKDDENENNN